MFSERKLFGGWEVSSEDSQSTIFSKTQVLNRYSFPVSLPFPMKNESLLSIPLKLVCGKGSWVWCWNPRFKLLKVSFANDFRVLDCSVKVVNINFRPSNIYLAPILAAWTRQKSKWDIISNNWPPKQSFQFRPLWEMQPSYRVHTHFSVSESGKTPNQSRAYGSVIRQRRLRKNSESLLWQLSNFSQWFTEMSTTG